MASVKKREVHIVLEIIDKDDLANLIRNLSLKEIVEYLKGKNIRDLKNNLKFTVTVTEFINDEYAMNAVQIDEIKKYKEAIFMVEHELTKVDILTIKLIAQGMTNQAISDYFGNISFDGVKKRIEQISKKLGVNTKLEISVIAAHEGII